MILLFSGDKKGPVPISRFKMHCAMLHADSDYRFSEEFKVAVITVEWCCNHGATIHCRPILAVRAYVCICNDDLGNIFTYNIVYNNYMKISYQLCRIILYLLNMMCSITWPDYRFCYPQVVYTRIFINLIISVPLSLALAGINHIVCLELPVCIGWIRQLPCMPVWVLVRVSVSAMFCHEGHCFLFQSCPATKKATWTNSDKPENSAKNRFTNVVACEWLTVMHTSGKLWLYYFLSFASLRFVWR